MLKLLIVNDRPFSKLSYKIIEDWFEQIIDESANITLISNRESTFTKDLIQASLLQYQIIALGDEASFSLIHHGITKHFKLPHPLGKNRKLNSKKQIALALSKCRTWIRED